MKPTIVFTYIALLPLAMALGCCATQASVEGEEVSEMALPTNADRVFRAAAAVPNPLPEPKDSPPLRLPEEFPIPMTFWSFMRVPADKFAQRLEEQEHYPVVHGVGPTPLENLPRVVKQRWPEKIVIRQSAYGGVGAYGDAKVWPGHFLYKVGTKLAHDVRAADTVIHVADFKHILKHPNELKNRAFPLTFTVYALDATGKPDWDKAEMMTLTAVGAKGELIVKRGAWGTQPLAFKADQAVAAVNMMFWTRQFQLNFSLQCPRGGPENLTAAEWFARRKAEEVWRTGADGIEFDVGRWTWGMPSMNPLDCDNNLVPDYGYINGVCSFGLGGRVFLRELRRILGPNKIIQVDSNNPMSLRGWDYLNGVQLECFPAENQFERFSEVFTHLRRWSENAGASPRFSYGFTKTPTTLVSHDHLPDGSPTDFRFRVGLAADCLVGMPHPFAGLSSTEFDPAQELENNKKVAFLTGVFAWDEYHGGDLNNWQWLGKPRAPAQQHLDDLSPTNLLAGVPWRWITGKDFEAKCEQNAAGGTATVKRIPERMFPEDLWYGVRFEPAAKLPFKLQPGKEYTLTFAVRGDDKWNYAGQVFEHVPRTVMIKGVGEGKVSASVNAESQWLTCRVSVIAAAQLDPAVAFGVSEQIGRTELRNISLRAGGCERWSRDFEHGKILLNMTRHPWKTDVGTGYRRLKGPQCPDVNNGAKVTGEITVSAWDALFLVRDSH